MFGLFFLSFLFVHGRVGVGSKVVGVQWAGGDVWGELGWVGCATKMGGTVLDKVGFQWAGMMYGVRS